MRVVSISLRHNDNETYSDRSNLVKNIIKSHKGVDLYMLPELWGVGFFSYEDYSRFAEDITGDLVSEMSALAREVNAYIFMGSFAEKRGEKLYNTAVLFNRNGVLCGKYSKAHLFGDEKQYMSQGNEAVVCDTEFGRAGISICYDMRFPELYRRMADMDAEIFLTCAAWPKQRAEHWDIFNRSRAIENQAIMLSCCSGGVNKGNEYAGISYAVEADGTVINKSSGEVSKFDIDTQKTALYRKNFGALSDRRNIF